MKKLFIIPIIILFISCSYRKSIDIYKGYSDQETFYSIMIFAPTFTNCPPIKEFSIPMEGITDHKADSINKLADEYIEKCEKYN